MWKLFKVKNKDRTTWQNDRTECYWRLSGVFIVNFGQISHSVSIVDLEQVNACWVGYRPMAKYLWKVSNADKEHCFDEIIVELKQVFARWVYFHHHKIKLSSPFLELYLSSSSIRNLNKKFRMNQNFSNFHGSRNLTNVISTRFLPEINT